MCTATSTKNNHTKVRPQTQHTTHPTHHHTQAHTHHALAATISLVLTYTLCTITLAHAHKPRDASPSTEPTFSVSVHRISLPDLPTPPTPLAAPDVDASSAEHSTDSQQQHSKANMQEGEYSDKQHHNTRRAGSQSGVALVMFRADSAVLDSMIQQLSQLSACNS
eukprot:3941884-Rhodomonas_salina.2